MLGLIIYKAKHEIYKSAIQTPETHKFVKYPAITLASHVNN